MGKTLYRAEILYDPGHDPGDATGSDPIRSDWGLLIDEAGALLESAPAAELSGRGDRVVHAPLISPGLVNAHVHLTDAGRRETVPGGEGLVPWVRNLLRSRAGAEPGEGIAETLQEMLEGGTVAIGEVSNDLGPLRQIEASGITTRFIYELIGTRAAEAEEAIERFRGAAAGADERPEVRFSPAIHAPYSVSLRLIDAIVAEARRRRVPTYIHLAEDPAERELYRSGGGEWRGFLEEIGVWDPAFVPPGEDPIDCFDRRGYLDPRFVAVHLTDTTDREIELLAARGAQAILSPTSNLHITDRLPPYRTIVRSGLRFALGTDGRGSNPSMNVLDEARLLAEAFPDESSSCLLHALIPRGASILGFPELVRLVPGSCIPLLLHSTPVAEPTEEGVAGVLLDRGNRMIRIA